jgi:alpha-methylacyl-CoA racemase
MNEALHHPHNVARGTFVEYEGRPQPAPAPRFSRTPGAITRPPALTGQHTREVLGEFGFAAGELDALEASGAVQQRA